MKHDVFFFDIKNNVQQGLKKTLHWKAFKTQWIRKISEKQYIYKTSTTINLTKKLLQKLKIKNKNKN